MPRSLIYRVIGFAFIALALAGCSAMTPGPMEAVRPISTAPRAGNVYLLRGWIGIFSTGIDNLGIKVNRAGVHGQVFQDDQWRELAATIVEKYKDVKDPEPLVLVGHSYGADDIIQIARELDKEHVPVDLLVTIDPTTPPPVPANVRLCYNLYQPNLLDGMPFLRGIALKAGPDFKGKLQNVNIRTERKDLLEGDVNHFNIEKKDKIHQETIKQILAICPPRHEWAATHRMLTPVAAAAANVQSQIANPPTTRPTASFTSSFLTGGQ
jgi:hypothetical protein